MTESSNLPDSQLTGDDDENYLIELLILLAKHKKLILGLTFFVALLALGISFLFPNIYTGIARLLPPQQTQATSAVLSQLGSLAGLAGGGVSSGLKNPNDLYVGMLKSRTVADNIIRRFDLNKVYHEKLEDRTRKELAKVTNITAGKDGIITIEVEDEDPKRAADLANAYTQELLNLTKVLAVTEASQRRLFFERETIQAKENLAKAEVAAKRALANGGLVGVEAEGRTVLETVARLRAEISVKEVQIGALRIFASEGNPKLKRAQQELEVLKQQVARRENVDGAQSVVDGAEEKSGVDNLARLRDLKYQEMLYELLVTQFQTAKIDEAKDSAIIQVMDKAIEPQIKTKPKRGLIVLLSAFGALMVGVLWAYVREGIDTAKANPRMARRLLDLIGYLAWK